MEKMLKKICSAVLVASVALLAVGCGSSGNASGTDVGGGSAPASAAEDSKQSGEKVTLTLSISDNNQQTVYEEKDLPSLYQEQYPNVTLEIEKIKDAGEYENAMKIRAASRQLPDIMVNKPYTLRRFKKSLIDLSDLSVVAKCPGAKAYAVDGQILGIPEKQSREFVFYWKSIFKDAGVEVPTTWDEFINAAVKLKEHDGKLIPIAMGAKDEWPDYPFNEYMPALETGDGFIWTNMASQDHPFAEGTPFNTAYHKIKKLYDQKIFGPDPLGIGNDQAVALFSQKQAAMHVSGAWALAPIKEGAGDVSDLGSFFLPTRDTSGDPFRTITQGDNFFGVSADSKHPDEAKAFIDWYFGDWYDYYVTTMDDLPSIDGVQKQMDPILQEAIDAQPDVELVMYDGGSDDFNSIITETKFDYKKLGVEMMTENFDLDARLKELDEAWAAARKTLNLN